MKTNNLYCLLLICLSFLSCRKEYQDFETVSYQINIQYPDNYSSSQVEGATIELKNMVTGASYSYVSDASGNVICEDILPGVYTMTASRTLSEDESEELTGTRAEAYLNANATSIKITESGQTTLKLKGGTIGGFVIKEFYYAGVPSAYFYDSYIEVYNNSTDTLYADSISVGNTKTNSPTGSVYGFLSTSDDVYLQHVFMVPGSGNDYPVAPGESFIIAVDGINHRSDPLGNPNSPVNLGAGIADFETYYSYSSRDADAADVPNMLHLYAASTAGFDWLLGVMGTGIVIFKHSDPASLPTAVEPGVSSTTRYIQIPATSIIDGVDCVANNTVTLDKKRLPQAIDAGTTSVGATYNGKSVRRKIKTEIEGRKILMDTNNSSQDFEINDNPNPKGW